MTDETDEKREFIQLPPSENARIALLAGGVPALAALIQDGPEAAQRVIDEGRMTAVPGVDLSFETAKKIPAREYKGWVVWPDAPVSSSSGTTEDYFRSVREVIEACAGDGIGLPAFVWATSEMHLTLDAHYILESALEEHHEDAIDGIPTSAIENLQSLLDAWAARPETKVTTYVEDRTCAVVFGDEEQRSYTSLRAAGDGVDELIEEVTR